VSTETEESPKKPTQTPEVKAKKPVVTPKQEPSQETPGSNVRVSGKRNPFSISSIR
jgi:hypothetical protein